MFADWCGAGHTYGESIRVWFPKNISRYRFNPATCTIVADIAEHIFPDYHINIEDFALEGCSTINMTLKNC